MFLTDKWKQMIISAAAFGQRSPWPRNGTTDVPKEGRRLGFITALTGATEGTIIKLLFPKVCPILPHLEIEY
jgi:hypothetical protein